jgi:hypothetical protein
MFALLCFVLTVLASPFKPRSQLDAENAALRHQLIILRRKVPGRVRLTNSDRWFFGQLYRLVRWHRAGFRCYWRWKSRSLGGRPQIDTDLRAMIRRMSIENPLWEAPRIHDELLKLGFEVAQSSVAKYMVERRGPLARYYNDRTHRSLDKDAPVSRPVQRTGILVHTRSLADFIITMSGFRFSVHTGHRTAGRGKRPDGRSWLRSCFSSAVSMISPSMSLLPTHIRMAVHTEVTNKRPGVEPRVFDEN